MDQGPLGILACAGSLPIEIAEAALSTGRPVHVVGIEGFVEPGITVYSHTILNIGQVGGMLSSLRRAGCRQLVIAGVTIVFLGFAWLLARLKLTFSAEAVGVVAMVFVALDVWAKTEQDATNLANLMIALALKAPLADAGCVRVEHLSGPNDVADPSGQPRRLSLIEATHRAAVLT